MHCNYSSQTLCPSDALIKAGRLVLILDERSQLSGKFLVVPMQSVGQYNSNKKATYFSSSANKVLLSSLFNSLDLRLVLH